MSESSLDIEKTVSRAIWCAMLVYGGPVYPMSWSDHSDFTRAQNPYATKKKSDIATDYEMVSFDEAHKASYWGYYSDGAEISKLLTEKLYADIESGVGVDWDHMTEPQEDKESIFNGTDSPSTEIPIMKGVLVMQNGNRYPWISNFETNMQNLKNLLTFIKKWESKTDAEVLDALKLKIENALTLQDWDFRCSMTRMPNETL